MIYHIGKEMVTIYARYRKQFDLLNNKKDKSDEEEANLQIVADGMRLAAIRIADCCEEQDDHEKSDEIISDFVRGK